MHHRLFRPALSGLAMMAALALSFASAAHAEPATAAASPTRPAYAARFKQLQQRLLMEGLSERIEKAREVRLTRRARLRGKVTASSARRAGASEKLPRDRFELDGAQGLHAAAPSGIGRTMSPTSANSLVSNVQVNNVSGDDPSAGQSEAAIAAWNQYVLVGWNDGQGFITGPDLLGYGYSTNGGTTFTDGGTPPRKATWSWTSDPVVAVNEKTGEFYFCGLVDTNLTSTVNGVAVVKATFSGSSIVWSTPRLVRATSSTTGFIDKPWIAVDSLSGNVYVSYTFFGVGGDSIDIQRSVNGGQGWSNPVKLSSNADAGRVQGSRPVVGPNGEVYAVWFAVGTDATFQDYFRTRKSTDFGVSFGGESTVSGLYSNFASGAPGFNREIGITYPSIAVDRTRGGVHSGRMYVAWNESINFYDTNLGTTAIVNDAEPNDAPLTATPIVMGNEVVGSLSTSSDFDYYSFTGIAGQTVIAYADSVNPALDMSFRMFCSDGVTRLSFSAPGAGQNNLLVFTLPATGTYYLRCASFSGAGYYSLATGFDLPSAVRSRDHRDAFTAYSDNGATWSTPVRMSDSPAGYDDWLPEVTVSAHGHPYAFWYDWRDAPVGNCGGVSNVYLARSDDDGLSWSTIGAISDVATNWTNVLSNIAPNQGDYLHVFSNATGVYPVWADGRNGTADVFSVALPLAITPTQASLVSAVAAPDHVTLTWFAGGSHDFIATVWRHDEGGEWASLGAVLPDGSGNVIYVDRDVVSGHRYAYRLGIPEGGTTFYTTETWVDMPRDPLDVMFWLGGARPNPAVRDLYVTFSLPTAAPATLTLFDLNGRMLRSKSVAAAGSQLVRLDDGIRLDPGVYLVRLTQSGRILTSRVSVVR
jgi:Bacterial pre-peptidase C-terminal domain